MRKFVTIATLATLVLPHATLIAQPAGDEFGQAKLMVNRDGRLKETKVILRLDADRLVVLSGEKELRSLPYNTLKSAAYTYARKPRWKEAIGMGFIIGVFAFPIFFLSGKTHWLTIHGEDHLVLLRLDKANYQQVLSAFETRSGMKVDTISEEAAGTRP